MIDNVNTEIHLGDEIRQFMAIKRWDEQKTFAEAAGVSESAISKVLSGKNLSMINYKKIRDYLDKHKTASPDTIEVLIEKGGDYTQQVLVNALRAAQEEIEKLKAELLFLRTGANDRRRSGQATK